jgi:hypothetical protein
MAAAAQIEANKILSGLVNPEDIAYRDNEAMPLVDHLAAWAESLAAEYEYTDFYIMATRARRVVALVMGAELADIDPPRDAK